MSNIQSVVNSLLARAAKVDPVMLSILQEIVDELDRIGIIIDPAPTVTNKISTAARDLPPPVTDLSYELTLDNVILSWSAPTTNFVFYEIRKGTVWSSATFITTTSNLQLFLDPIAVGTHTYLIRTLSTQGEYSEAIDSIDITIPALGSISISVQQISNNVLLSWTPPSSTFRINEYLITKGGSDIGSVKGTFFTIFETSGGTYTYGVTAVDIAGNQSAEALTTVIVSNPDNFILRNSFTSAFGGTLTNAKNTGNNSLLVCINLTETYQQHFDTRSWAGPQAQVTAGYDRWLSPFLTTASYLEQFDCGTIHTNTIITLSWSVNIINGSFTIGTSTRVSDDGSTWSSPNTNSTFLAASVRYIEVTINFTGGNDKALLEFYNFQVSASVRQELDSGQGSSLAADASGTVNNFNKTFKAVDSVTATVLSGSGSFVIVQTITTTSFKALVYDAAGSRVNGDIYWKARGII